MILLAHLIFGALIGQTIANPILAIILAFFGHYFLDLFPHVEYSIDKIRGQMWKKALPEILKIFLDFSFGILLVSMFSANLPIIYVCAFFAILPDGFTVLSNRFPNIVLKLHNKFHFEKIHWFKQTQPSHEASARQEKISLFWRIFSQVFVVIISIILLKI